MMENEIITSQELEREFKTKVLGCFGSIIIASLIVISLIIFL